MDEFTMGFEGHVVQECSMDHVTSYDKGLRWVVGRCHQHVYGRYHVCRQNQRWHDNKLRRVQKSKERWSYINQDGFQFATGEVNSFGVKIDELEQPSNEIEKWSIGVTNTKSLTEFKIFLILIMVRIIIATIHSIDLTNGRKFFKCPI